MYMIEITEKKYDKLSEHIEESLRHLGKAMSCIAEIGEPYGMGHRDDEYPHEGGRSRSMTHGGYGGRYDRMNYREDDEREMWDEDDMHERRRRSRRTGRYI